MSIFGNKPDPDTQRDKEVADRLIEDAQARRNTMIDWTKPIELNDGTPCKVVHVFKDGCRLVVYCNESECVRRCLSDGTIYGFSLSTVRNTPPPKRKGTVWVNVYQTCANASHTKEGAEAYSSDRLAFIEVPWEEGQGL